MSLGTYLTGTVDPEEQIKTAQTVQAPDQNAYSINGLQGYQQQMQGLGTTVPGANDYQTANAAQMGQQDALQRYFQDIAMGRGGPTASDQMFQNAQGANARQMQSSMVAAQGMNPALGMRQMANSQAATQGQLAGQGAAHKLQEQQSYGQMAQTGSQAMVTQKMQQMQQNYMEQMQTNNAKAQLAQHIFDSSRDQTGLNVQYQQHRQAYQMFQAQAQMQAKKDEAAGKAALIRMMLNGGVQMGAAALTSGGSLAGQLAAGAASGAAQGATSAASNGTPLQYQYGNTYGGVTGSTDLAPYKPTNNASGYNSGMA